MKYEFSSPIATKLFNHLISDTTFINDIKSHFVIDGIVESVDLNGNRIPNTKRYGMVGVCGITYLVYDGRSKKAKELDDVVYGIKRAVWDYVARTFTPQEHEYFESWGCPIMAVLQQNQDIQCEIYHRVVEFAKNELGIKKIKYRSVID